MDGGRRTAGGLFILIVAAPFVLILYVLSWIIDEIGYRLEVRRARRRRS